MTAEREINDVLQNRKIAEDQLDLLLRDGADGGEDGDPSEDSGFDSFLERFPTAVREPVRPRGAGS